MGNALRTRLLLESLLAAAAAFISTIIATFPMLPVIMQDEYVYRRQVLLLEPANYDYPNYLFSALASFSESSPLGFYFSIKIQNALVVALAVGVIYWAISQLTSKLIAIVSSGLFLTVPAFFQSSFYMPDMFISGFLAASLALLLLAAKREVDWRNPIWYSSAFMLLAALLSKPHALFFLFGLLLFGVIHFIRTRKTSPVFAVVAVALASRFVIGYLVAGPAGLNLLGSSYSQSLVGAPQQITQQTLTAAGAEAKDSIGNLFSMFLLNTLQLFVALALASLGLIVLVLLRSFRSPENLLLSVVIFTGIGAIAAFETLVSAAGDNHSDRILTRHLEYLVALIVGLGLFELQKHKSITKKNVLPLIGLVAIAVLGGSFILGTMPRHLVSDGAFIILSGLWGGGYLIATTVLAALFWFTKLSPKHWPATLVIIVLAAVNISAHSEIRSAYSVKTAVDEFAESVAANLDLSDRQVFVIANAKASAELFMFYTVPEMPNIAFYEPGSSIDVGASEEPASIFFPLEDISIVTNCEAKQIGTYTYYDCQNLSIR